MSLTRVSLICKTCGYTARRDLGMDPGCRGIHETRSVQAFCINGHGLLSRKDGWQEESADFEWKDTKENLAAREKAKKGIE